MKKKIKVAAAFLMLLSIGCVHKKSEQTLTAPVAVQTKKVEYKESAPPVVCSGMVTSSKESGLSFKTGGMIARMYARQGQLVQKGDLLATLDMTEVDAQVGQLQASYTKAKRDYQRSGKLLLDSAITRERWENSESTLLAAEEALKIASFNRKSSSIYATQTGMVISKLSNEGEFAGPGAPVYIINSTGLSDWVIRVGVSDRDWARLALKDKAEITLDAYPGEVFIGNVCQIEQAADLGSGTFLLDIKLSPSGHKFANGLVGKVRIFPSHLQQVYLIPIEALHEADDQSGNVFSVLSRTKRAAVHRVKIAYVLDNQVAVSSGLENVEEVITEGASYLVDDLPVQLSNHSQLNNKP